MYHRYFGLNEAPFSIAVNPRYLFMSARHRDALAHLLYGVGAGGGFILLTGPVGTGKTTITRSLLEQLPQNADIALILNPTLSAVELLATACDELGINYSKDEQQLKPLTDKLHAYLLDNFAKGRNTVLLIDEAQHLQFETLEQIRLLTNLETNTKKLLQIILVGQPELKQLLNKPELSQLAQRITARYTLTALNQKETKAYIRHRLHVAGLPGNQQLFSDRVIQQIYKTSQGIPRLINVLCDRMLLGSYGKNKSSVDQQIVKQAINEIKGEDLELKQDSTNGVAKLGGGALAVAVVAALSLFTWQWFNSPINEHALNGGEAKASASTTNEKRLEIKWDRSQETAMGDLLTHLTIQSDTPICSNSSFRCDTLTVKTWQELSNYQRPVILKLITPAKTEAFTTLVGLNPTHAEIIKQGKKQQVSLKELGPLWTGEFILLWQPPPHYKDPINLGDTSPAVSWLAEKFALLDQQKAPLATDTFNQALQKRVIIFQQTHQLSHDGVVGLKTLLKINEQLSTVQLLNELANNADNTSTGNI